MSEPHKFKRGDRLIILDPYLRKTAPPGRSKITINTIFSTGWASITYEDGLHDFIMLSQLHNHWGYSPGERTKLWKVING